jgi:hypothetical protein
MPFRYLDATISARELTIGGEEDSYALARLLAGDSDVLVKQARFAEYQYAAQVDGDEPVPRVTVEDGEAAARAAYAAWRKLPASFQDCWLAEVGKTEKAAKNVSG